MEPIKLSQKAEEEIVNAAKMAALSNLTEKSQNLITLEDIATPVTFDQQSSRPRYIAGEVVRWGRINAKHIS